MDKIKVSQDIDKVVQANGIGACIAILINGSDVSAIITPASDKTTTFMVAEIATRVIDCLAKNGELTAIQEITFGKKKLP